MPQNLTNYNLLFSCPGDAYSQCYSVIKTAVDDFNKYAKSSLSISVELTHWSTDSYPQSGGRPQTLLNTQIVDTADAAIAVFWTRFGTPTDEYGSGTEEEIERLIAENKQVFLYFLDKAIPPTLTDTTEYKEHRSQITLFKRKYESKGIYRVVADEDELKTQFAQHLFLYFAKRVSEDTDVSTKKEKSALTITAVDGSNEAQVHFLNLSLEMGMERCKHSIINKIKEVQVIALPATAKAEERGQQELSPNLSESPSKLFVDLANSLKVSDLLSSKKDAVISEEDMRIVANFCTANGMDLSPDFWDFGGLQIQISKAFNAMVCNPEKSLCGSDEAQKKYKTTREIISDILQYNDSTEYYSKMDRMPFIELIARNQGTAFDEDIEIDLLLPPNSLMKAEEFPVPLYELDEIVVNKCIDDWLCPVITADIDEFDYSLFGLNNIPYIPPIFPFQQRDFMAEYVQKKEEYYNRIKELMDWNVFTQGANDVVKIRINKLNQFRSMHFPSPFFLKFVPDKISFSIKAKYTSSVIKGEITISNN